MLVVLSEINCIHVLNQNGIYPDEFYTDFELFKNRLVSVEDAKIVIIVAGVCRFYRKLLIELCKILYKRLHDDADTGVKEFYILTDANLPQLDEYYKFQYNFNKFEEFSGWDNLGEVDVFSQLRNEPKESAMFLSDFDSVNIDKAISDYENRHNTEDE